MIQTLVIINSATILFAPLVEYSMTLMAVTTRTVSTLLYRNGGDSRDNCNRDEQFRNVL